MAVFLGILVGIILGLILGFVLAMVRRKLQNRNSGSQPQGVAELLRQHFHPTPVSQINITSRTFPARVRADLHRSLDELINENYEVSFFSGLQQSPFEGISLAGALTKPLEDDAIRIIPPEFEELDLGEDQPLRALTNGLWLLRRDGEPYVLLMGQTGRFERCAGIRVQIGMRPSNSASSVQEELFCGLEMAVQQGVSYRGKILSLEESDHAYSGQTTGITVHRLRTVERDQIVLPPATLAMLERNVIQFVNQRERLAKMGQSTRKGILFYGRPGTGKTHTIHYLARALPGHTTLLISAEQVGLLGEYMTLARLLQPSLVVIEDADLIARERTSMSSPCEEVLLNKLLNEMDGLKESANILFILTTNRPEALEAALAARPGRIDQAIEFPPPDEDGRRKLVRLYAPGHRLSDDIVTETARRTAGASGAFIKELMRRAVQFQLERNGDGEISRYDIDLALDELLFQGGSVNLKLLGGAEPI